MVSRLVSSGVKMEFAHFFFSVALMSNLVDGLCSFLPQLPPRFSRPVSSLRAGTLALNVPSSCSRKTRLSLTFDAYASVSIRNRRHGSAQHITTLIPEISFCSPSCLIRPVIVEIPHFGSMRGQERELIILRSENGESWKEHLYDCKTDDLVQLLAGMDEGTLAFRPLLSF